MNDVRVMARWFVIAVTLIALAGLAGVISLDRAIDNVHDQRKRDCETVTVLNTSIGAVLDALSADPLTPESIRQIIARQEAIIAKSIEALNKC
jgi:predicted GTPase